MLKFLTLTISNFKVFRQRQVFHFPKRAGLYSLSGKNKLNPEVGGNAIGKSSLFDALSFVLYGKTARGLKAADISSWGSEETPRVELDFRKDKQDYNLVRTWKPNSLTLNGEAVTQDEIEKLIGFNHDAFMSVILLGQFNENFLSLGPTEKLSVFSDILNLEFWEQASDKARDKAKAISEEIHKLQLDVVKRKSEYKSIQQQIEDERIKAKQWAETQKGLIEVAEKGFLDRQRELALSDMANEKVEKLHAEVVSEISTEEAGLQEVEQEIKVRRQALDKCNQQMTELRREWEELSKNLDRIAKGEVLGICPMCGTKLRGLEHLREESTRVADRRAEVKLNLNKLTRQVNENRPGVEQAERLLQKDKDNFAIRAKQRRDLAEKAMEARFKAKDAAKAVLDAKKRLETLQKAYNSHDEWLETLEYRLDDAKSECKWSEDSLGKADAQLKGFEFWKTEFRNLRLWLIEEALTQFEIETNNALLELGLRDWRVTYDVEKITRAGKVSRGFSVFVQSPTSPEMVRWESWSGGENSRICFSGTLALSRLIRNRFGIDCPLECFDEPFAHGLSVEGVQDGIEFLSQRAKDERRVIFLIEHHTREYPFDGRYEIVLNSKGSIIRKV